MSEDSTTAASRSLLLVAPKGGIAPTEEFLEARAYELLSARKASLRHGLMRAVSAFPFYGQLLGTLVRTSVCNRGAFMRGSSLAESKPIVIEVLRALYRDDPQSVFPDMMVLQEDDARLGNLACL